MISKQEFDVEQWLDSRSRKSLHEAISEKILAEKKERLLRNTNSSIDYGYSFGGLYCIKIDCLKAIRAYYQTTGIRPVVADIGAGLGSMTWKLLAASAQVDAFEIQKPSAEELLTRMKSITPYFWEEEELDTILTVYPENAITRLKENTFKEKYDFIWMSQVIHFLTPDDIMALKSIFQEVLKPNGKVFIDANTYYSIEALDKNKTVLRTYEQAKQKKLNFPGFLTFNAATLIDHTIDKVVAMTTISAFDNQQMKKYSIPFETNAYGKGYAGPKPDEKEEGPLHLIKRDNPSHCYSINRFYQTTTLLDEKTAPLVFKQEGFSCVSYLFNPFTGETLSNPISSETPCLLAIQLEKVANKSNLVIPINSLLQHSLLSSNPHDQLVIALEKACANKKTNASFFEAIDNKDYGLALRKASAVAHLDFVKILLKHKVSLSIDVNGQSNNKCTALDWINKNQKADYLTKERVIALLERAGAKSGLDEDHCLTATKSQY